MSFAELFLFSRPIARPARGMDGVAAMLDPGEPRFDHDINGRPLGLLVEGGARLGEGDRVELDRSRPWWESADRWTILHAHRPAGNPTSIVRKAHFCEAVHAADLVDACLGLAGHHVTIGAVPAILGTDRRGEVRYAGHGWQLDQLLGDTQSGVLSVGQRPVIG